MKIYINTTQTGHLILKIDGDTVVENSPDRRSQYVLVLLEKELKKRGLTTGDISEVEVETGPGSFTGVRVGVSVANALGYALGVPVNRANIKKDGPISPQY